MGECRIGTGTDGQERKERLIMVLDPDAGEQYFLSILLQRFGYNICTAKNVEDIRETIEVAVPALILSALPPGSRESADLLRMIRTDPRTASLPLIFVLPAGTPGANDRCVSEGAVACLTRPIMPEPLYQAVQAALEPTPRKNIRVEVRLPVKVNGKALDCEGGECASVLSVHGMYVRTLNPSPAKTMISIQFRLRDRLVAAEALVLYRHSYGEGPFKEPGMGLRFERISPQDQEFLQAFIRSQVLLGLNR